MIPVREKEISHDRPILSRRPFPIKHPKLETFIQAFLDGRRRNRMKVTPLKDLVFNRAPQAAT